MPEVDSLEFVKQRLRAGMSIDEAAALLGVTPRQVRRYESGEVSVPGISMKFLKVHADERIAAHPKAETWFSFIDLFAGIGGMRLAFEAIGGRCAFTCEWDKYSQQTYRKNFPDDDDHPFASDSDEAALLFELFDLDPEFLIGEFDPAELKQREHERVLDFAEQVIAAWLKGEIDLFARNNAAMPNTADLALLARRAFLEKYGLADINPFRIETPGDVLREISRSVEWDLSFPKALESRKQASTRAMPTCSVFGSSVTARSDRISRSGS
jgi:transcriptional regulator with XRE-family HTH domain